jgi:hypothetical protein
MVLYYTVLYCTVLRCIVLHYIVLQCTVLHCTVLQCSVCEGGCTDNACVDSTLHTHVRSSPPSGFLSCLDWLSVCLLVGNGDDVTPCPAPCPRVRAPELSICRSRVRARAAVSWVQDSMTWLSRPLPRNVRHSEAALSASKGVENLYRIEWNRMWYKI